MGERQREREGGGKEGERVREREGGRVEMLNLKKMTNPAARYRTKISF